MVRCVWRSYLPWHTYVSYCSYWARLLSEIRIRSRARTAQFRSCQCLGLCQSEMRGREGKGPKRRLQDLQLANAQPCCPRQLSKENWVREGFRCCMAPRRNGLEARGRLCHGCVRVTRGHPSLGASVIDSCATACRQITPQYRRSFMHFALHAGQFRYRRKKTQDQSRCPR